MATKPESTLHERAAVLLALGVTHWLVRDRSTS
jgi:hypothetical protein